MSSGIDIEIDTLSPCLIDVATGNILDTVFSEASKDELQGLQKQGWVFNWATKDLSGSEIYKVTIKGDKQIQGLVALDDDSDNQAVYLKIVEAAPHNRENPKKYKGVGGHLFAIAVKRSMDLGYNGFLFMDAKNMKLVNYYREKLGAVHIGGGHLYRMQIDEGTANNLIEVYTLQEE